MKLIKLDPDHADIPRVKQINAEAFPDNERVEIDDLFNFGSDGTMDILGIYPDEEIAGFFVILTAERIVYIAYFAVSAEKRSRGMGSAALAALRELYRGRQVVVDFESVLEPDTDTAQRERRRAFYLRNGFYATGWYMFYMDAEFEITSSEAEFDKGAFEQMIADIHARAPMFDPHLYRHDR